MQAELTNYWDQAYHSSRFCDYFLPEYWNNPFGKEGADNKYLFDTETAVLDSTYIPLVEIYSEILGDEIKKDQFPVYTLKYDETQTVASELLEKAIFADLFSSDSKIFKETAQQEGDQQEGEQQEVPQQNHIVVNVNQKLYKNYYIAKNGGKK